MKGSLYHGRYRSLCQRFGTVLGSSCCCRVHADAPIEPLVSPSRSYLQQPMDGAFGSFLRHSCSGALGVYESFLRHFFCLHVVSPRPAPTCRITPFRTRSSRSRAAACHSVFSNPSVVPFLVLLPAISPHSFATYENKPPRGHLTPGRKLHMTTRTQTAFSHSRRSSLTRDPVSTT